MKAEDLAALADLRRVLFAAIANATPHHGKSYEGAMTLHMPDWFQQGEPRPDAWAVEIHCYVLGPGRHYQYEARTLGEAVAKARADVDAWIAEEAIGDQEPS
jgi:hypothetical protein